MTLVRPARADDVPAVLGLERRVFAADAWSERSVYDELTGPSRRALVVEDGGQVVGYLVVLGGGDVADLQRIAVAPAFRRRGLAGSLLDACDLTPYARMLLEVRADNAPALSFYRGRGFVEISRRRAYYADGCAAVVMEQDFARTRIVPPRGGHTGLVRPRTATRRRHLATSPFAPPEDPPPIEPFSENERVVHDRYGLGRVVAVEGDTAVLVDFGNARVRIPATAFSQLSRI